MAKKSNKKGKNSPAKMPNQNEGQAAAAKAGSLLERQSLQEERAALEADKLRYEEGQIRLAEIEKDVRGHLDRLKAEGEEEVQTLKAQWDAQLKTLKEQGEAKVKEDLKAFYNLQDKKMAKELEEWKSKLQFQWTATEEELAKRKNAWYEEREEKLREQEQKLKEEGNALHQKEQALLAEKNRLGLEDFKLEEERKSFAQKVDILELTVKELREENQALEDGKQGEIAKALTEFAEKNQNYEELWEEFQDLQEEHKEFRQSMGDTPELLQSKLRSLQEDNHNLKTQLVEMVPRSVKEERDQLSEQMRNLQSHLATLNNSDLQIATLAQELKQVTQQRDDLSGELRDAQSTLARREVTITDKETELARFTASSASTEDYEERVNQLTTGFELPTMSQSFPLEMKEMDWLSEIQNSCETVQMVFPRRILFAFHTAMKISDWSIVTVLSGVSGTGKSKLPELYAKFGGLNFFSVSVEPSWDSQESMLGFYNSMDNRFEAEPLLKYLLATTKLPEDAQEELYHKIDKLKNNIRLDESQRQRKAAQWEDDGRTVSLVLLDEMNLAHVEQYFAQFLSKLESRRGQLNVPAVDVKLGTGVAPYPLPLCRNILWSGTMNEDETTKSLSDKVLDRGVVIGFPRPNEFLRRSSQANEDKLASQKRLCYELWRSWQERDTRYKQGDKKSENYNQELETLVTEYKTLVEEINRLIAIEGRAFGHRVWQVIEYYVVNYPLVVLAMEKNYAVETDTYTCDQDLKNAVQIAMEDQMVQKIMPKLRGISWETNGVLDEIGALLEKKFSRPFMEDYENACQKKGYQQFMWIASSYSEDANNETLFKLLDKLNKTQEEEDQEAREEVEERDLSHE